jgi:hypothetical protein
MTALRFGVVSESVREGRAWLDFARRVEGAGEDSQPALAEVISGR